MQPKIVPFIDDRALAAIIYADAFYKPGETRSTVRPAGHIPAEVPIKPGTRGLNGWGYMCPGSETRSSEDCGMAPAEFLELFSSRKAFILAGKLPARWLAFIHNVAGQWALTKGYGKDEAASGELAAFCSTGARCDRLQRVPCKAMSCGDLSMATSMGWTRMRTPTVEKNSFLQFFDVIFGNSQQVSIAIPSQPFDWKDFLFYGRGIMKEAPNAAIDAMQRHNGSLPRLQHHPDLQHILLHCASLRHALDIAWTFADRPEKFVSKMGAYVSVRRGCEDLEADDECRVIQDVLVNGECLSQEGLSQWLHVALTRHLSRDLVQLLELLVPVSYPDKILQALHNIRQKAPQPLCVDMGHACTFVQNHPDHWLSSWLLSNMCCYVGHSRFACITSFNWDSLVSAAGAVLAAGGEDFRGELGLLWAVHTLKSFQGSGHPANFLAALLRLLRQPWCGASKDAFTQQGRTGELKQLLQRDIPSLVELPFEFWQELLHEEEPVSAAWASSCGAWFVHAIAIASLRCYPQLCTEHAMHSYEMAEKVLTTMDRFIRSCPDGPTCKSLFVVVVLLRSMAPVLAHFDLANSVELSALPEISASLKTALCFHRNLVNAGYEEDSQPFWSELLKPLVSFFEGAKQVLSHDIESLTVETADQLFQSRVRWMQIQDVMRECQGWVAPEDVFDRRQYEQEHAEVAQLSKILQWLADRDIEGCAGLLQEIDLGASSLTLKRLRTHRSRVQRELRPLQSNLKLLQHFVDRESQFFNAAVLLQATEHPGQTMADAALWVDQTDRLIQALLRTDIKLQDAKVFIDMTQQVNIPDELAKITSFEGYAHTSEELPATIQRALKLLQYSVAAHVVAAVAKGFGLVPDDDPDIRYIELESQRRPNRLLREAPKEYEKLEQLFRCPEGSLRDIHFSLIAKFRDCSAVIDFFKEIEYVSVKGQHHFEQIKNSLTIQLRGQNVERMLLNEEVCRLVTPFLTRCNSLADFVKNLVVGKSWENAMATSRALDETGTFVVQLNALEGKPHSACVNYLFDGSRSVRASSSKVRMSEAETRELLRQLVFHSKGRSNQADGQSDCYNAARTCSRKLKKVFEILQCLQDLEASGHPEFQLKELEFSLGGSLSTLSGEAEDLKRRQDAWKSLLQSSRVQCELLSLFDSRELFVLIALSTPGHAQRKRVVESLLGQTEWPEDENNRKSLEATLAAQCLENVLHSLRDLAVVPNDLMQRLMNFWNSKSLPTEALPLEQAMKQLKKTLEKLGIQAAKRALGSVSQGHYQAAMSLPADSWRSEISLLARAGAKSDRCILRCHPSLQLHGLDDFFQRVELVSGGTFVVLGVNSLPLPLQKRVQEIQCQLHDKEKAHGRVFYTYTGIQVPPQPDFIHEMTVQLLDDDELRSAFGTRKDSITVVYGPAGSGKTDMLHSTLGSDTPLLSITAHFDEKRAQVTMNRLAAQDRGIGLKISEDANHLYVNRLLFDLLICRTWRLSSNGSVFAAGPSKRLTWCIEVPDLTSDGRPTEDMSPAASTLHIFPVLNICHAELKMICDNTHQLRIGTAEHFVAKFLQAGLPPLQGGQRAIDKLGFNVPVRHPEVVDDFVCRQLIYDAFRTSCSQTPNKRNIKSFVRYLERRFRFFESDFYIYNTKYSGLGSAVFDQMIREAAMLTATGLGVGASHTPKPMLVYDSGWALYLFEGRGEVPRDLIKYVADGRQYLQQPGRDMCDNGAAMLAWTLDLQEREVKEACCELGFVLVEDFTFRLLCIHERRLAGEPVIIEGLTGVGKTFPIKVYAHLLNYKLLKKDSDFDEAPRTTWRVKTWLRESILPRIGDQQKRHELNNRLLESSWTDTALLVELFEKLQEELDELQRQDTAELLAPPESLADELWEKVAEWLDQCPLLEASPRLREYLEEMSPTPGNARELLSQFLQCPVASVFHRLLLHPDLNVPGLENFLGPILDLAKRVPRVKQVVLFDELNTSEILGILNEIIVDHTFQGVVLPDNLFFLGCMNPYTPRNSATGDGLGDQALAHREEYFVHKLPTSMMAHRWQFPPLERTELQEFVKQKIKLQFRGCSFLGEHLENQFALLMCKSQELFLQKVGQSSVSQRDLQRCLIVLEYFQRHWPGSERPNDRVMRCILLSLAVVYYFRLSDGCNYGMGDEAVTGHDLKQELCELVQQVVGMNFQEEVTYGVNCYISEQNFLLPEGVALNRDLKENLFAMLITTQTKLASCILGSPGRGKTLAFEVLVQNLRGAQSPKEFCKRFRAVDPFFYQCSPDSKAAEIEDILSGATRREQMYEQHGGKERCVPFFDEAQLPQECRMVMKPLHDVLDERQVATIIVSGSPLDAANMNRMSIFIRHTQTLEDFMEIGLGVLGKSGIGRLAA
ncbi:unnamed protein product [Symbiodinium sp. KB8]|nr:unnamed protein product [Symbiodinium sp. KB8]